ncbi:MAG: NAD(P)-binding domain-containing protein [Acidobacteriota bacterium]
MKVAFIGYGSMARALAKRWAPAHEVFIGGRRPERAGALADDIRAAGSGTTAEAAQFGDIIVLATPAGAVGEAIEDGGGAGAFAGKVVIDINNPVSVPAGPHDSGGDHYLPRHFDEGSLAQHIAALVPDAHVVKAFNMCQASVWEMDPPEFDGRRLTALYCGDDDDAKAKVAELIEALGCEPVDAGELKYARLLEACASLVIKFLFSGRDLKTVLNLIQPEVKPI